LAKTISNNNALTAQVLEANTINHLRQHCKNEIAMSILLETATIKESLFPDFDGIIKVLVLGWRFCNGAFCGPSC
jgi:hypothetical protein